MYASDINQSITVNFCNIDIFHLLKLRLVYHFHSLPMIVIWKHMYFGLYGMRKDLIAEAMNIFLVIPASRPTSCAHGLTAYFQAALCGISASGELMHTI